VANQLEKGGLKIFSSSELQIAMKNCSSTFISFLGFFIY